jgi:hypothetical protein
MVKDGRDLIMPLICPLIFNQKATTAAVLPLLNQLSTLRFKPSTVAEIFSFWRPTIARDSASGGLLPLTSSLSLGVPVSRATQCM